MAPAGSSGGGAPPGNPSDGEQTAVPYAAIPFLAILGAVAVMLIIWAFARLLADPEPLAQNFPDEQMHHMREVRHRNRQDIADLFSHRAHPHPQRYSRQFSLDADSKMSSVQV